MSPRLPPLPYQPPESTVDSGPEVAMLNSNILLALLGWITPLCAKSAEGPSATEAGHAGSLVAACPLWLGVCMDLQLSRWILRTPSCRC